MALKRLSPPKGDSELDEEKREIGTLAGSASLAESIPWGPVMLGVLALFLLTIFDADIQRQVFGGSGGGYCGDGICNPTESTYSCPADCLREPLATLTPEPTEAFSTPEPKRYELKNAGSRLGFSNVEYFEVAGGGLAEAAPDWIAMKVGFDFPNDEPLAAVEEKGINVLGRLDSAQATLAKAEELARRYSGRDGGPVIKYYEIDGASAAGVKAAYEGVKAGCPECSLVVSFPLGGLEKIEEIASGCRNGCFDAVGLKAYDKSNRSKSMYVGIGGEMDKIRGIFKEYRLEGKEIWVTELGFYSGSQGGTFYRTDEEQAGVLIRGVVFSLASGASKVFLGYPGGCVDTQDTYYCSVGITGRPALGSFNALKTALDDSDYIGQFDSAASKKGFAFQTPRGKVYVAWSDDFTQAYASTGFSTEASKVRLTDLVSMQTAVLNVTTGRVSTGIRENPLMFEEIG
ncbi:MAG: hypothetical protein V1787_04685 [Candidatus Micrarchaeota archaeon]